MPLRHALRPEIDIRSRKYKKYTVILSAQMKEIARNYTIGHVATVNEDGAPNLSSREPWWLTMMPVSRLVKYAPPITGCDIRGRPVMGINFLDIFARKCFRPREIARVIDPARVALADLQILFDQWGDPAHRSKEHHSLARA